jgi:hypothetical protein
MYSAYHDYMRANDMNISHVQISNQSSTLLEQGLILISQRLRLSEKEQGTLSEG